MSCIQAVQLNRRQAAIGSLKPGGVGEVEEEPCEYERLIRAYGRLMKQVANAHQ